MQQWRGTMYKPNKEWNFQQCQMTRIHLRHPISHTVTAWKIKKEII